MRYTMWGWIGFLICFCILVGDVVMLYATSQVHLRVYYLNMPIVLGTLIIFLISCWFIIKGDKDEESTDRRFAMEK